MAERTARKANMIELADFLLLFSGERRPGAGEDSYAYSLHEEGAMLGVFDGCGGSGACRFPALQDRTGAYLAARAVSSAWLHWYEGLDPAEEPSAEDVKLPVLRNLRVCEQRSGEPADGKAKRLPTTAAVALCRPRPDGAEVRLQWAGDSRVYWLDEEGLAQLTEDDLGGVDPMENLSQNARLTNAVSLSRAFRIHSACLKLDRPGLLFAASDGCFGYVSTPMEFEYLLLATLAAAGSAADWEKSLRETVGRISRDDYTLCGLSLGCGSFDALQRLLRARTRLLERDYINGLDACSPEEKQLLWERYKDHYLRLLCRP